MTHIASDRHAFAIPARLGALAAVALSCAVLPAAQAAGVAYPPNLAATAGTLSPAPAQAAPQDVTCTAVGNWFTDTSSGAGSWTKTATLKCKAKGTWTDAFTYTWVLTKDHKSLSGTVTYHGIPGCTADVWPVAGTILSKKTFTVTATNPIANDTTCSPIFGYNLTIQ